MALKGQCWKLGSSRYSIRPIFYNDFRMKNWKFLTKFFLTKSQRKYRINFSRSTLLQIMAFLLQKKTSFSKVRNCFISLWSLFDRQEKGEMSFLRRKKSYQSNSKHCCLLLHMFEVTLFWEGIWTYIKIWLGLGSEKKSSYF